MNNFIVVLANVVPFVISTVIGPDVGYSETVTEPLVSSPASANSGRFTGDLLTGAEPIFTDQRRMGAPPTRPVSGVAITGLNYLQTGAPLFAWSGIAAPQSSLQIPLISTPGSSLLQIPTFSVPGYIRATPDYQLLGAPGYLWTDALESQPIGAFGASWGG